MVYGMMFFCFVFPSGKKSPVYGKWKDLYFVLQCKERKLLFYEQESVRNGSAVRM